MVIVTAVVAVVAMVILTAMPALCCYISFLNDDGGVKEDITTLKALSTFILMLVFEGGIKQAVARQPEEGHPPDHHQSAEANAQYVQVKTPAAFERLKTRIRVHRKDNSNSNQPGGSYL
ncbi:hypothetical protein JRQ81_015865 [Phrynocephalus forsythii]|uniref:Uncharacterized protein n=1 Tax=Phrynocephalus forsythii TaxID=171643 RepID=A0A9Q1B1T7_9SAUR|nr:hypothetical protein JRQ81_015865 [Phrynocephalus forsythii]